MKSLARGPRTLCGVLLPLAASCLLSTQVFAETATPTSAAAKAANVLSTHCARCHQAEHVGEGTPAGGFGNILALDEIARDPALVRPGVPDGSALYFRMLHRHRPLAFSGGAGNGTPKPEEIAAVRAWIEGLDASHARCRRALITAETMARLMQAWLRRLDAEAAKQARFVTLAHFHNACASDAEMAGYRQAVGKLLNRLSHRGWPVQVEALGDELALLAFTLSELGWDPEDWEKLARAHPQGSAVPLPAEVTRATGTRLPVLRADWLAHASPPSPDGAADPDIRLHGLEPVTALARRYDRPADLTIAAAELGLEVPDLSARLKHVEGEARALALRLAQGLLGRAELERLFVALRPDGAAQLPQAENVVVEDAPPRLTLGLWSERASYSLGDLASFHVTADVDCYLTMIGVDTAGRATVIFPNDLEPANLIKAGHALRIPAAEAPYQLRFTERGRETLIAMCSTHAETPAGIAHDFERQRFTLLGDWEKFITAALAKGSEAHRSTPKVRLRGHRTRVRKRNEPKPEPRPGPELVAHTAIVVRVD